MQQLGMFFAVVIASILICAMIWLLLTVIGVAEVSALAGYRLPGNVKPTHYILEVLTELEDPNFKFSGEVWIKVECIQPTNTIILHSKNLNITEEETTVKEIVSKDELVPMTVTSQKLVKENEFLIIKLEQNLKQGVMYIVHLTFAGPLLEDLAGYYRSSYIDQQSNSTKWLAVTQFEATDARKAFPCFDEPEMKAKFTVRLAHKNNFKAVSNMPLTKTVPYEGKENYMWSHFEDSVPMSTYLVAYLVSEFEFKEAPARHNNVTFRIWSRKDALSQTEFAQDVGPKVLEYYETYFDEKYPLPKQDMAAIPDFSAGAMENWGLVTYRETALLYDDKASSKVSQHQIAYVIAHELAHQWFGNLVTMKWWTDLWLNEGFATYVGTLGVEKLFPEWGYLRESVLDFARFVFDLDSLVSSHPVSKKIGHPDEISQIFDTISYKKGCVILRMMHLFLGDSFRTGVTKYLKKHKYGNAEQDDLWAALTEQAHADGSLDQSLTVKEVMDTWTVQTGYPLVTVVRDYEKGTAKLTQKRYLQLKTEGPINDTCWWIPITYTTQDKLDFKDNSPKLWMNCANRDTVELTKLDPNSWLLLNIDIGGLYRVQYDDQNWKLLSDTLNSDKYSDISITNRADIVMTILDLAWTGDIAYEQAISLVNYLAREKEWLPWKTGLNKLGALNRILSRTPSYSYFKEFMTKLISPIYQEYNKLTEIPEQHDKVKLHIAVSKWAVDLEIGDSLKQVQELFAKWMQTEDPDKNNPIPKDLRSNVYCNSVWYGGPHIWDFLFKRYLNSNVGTDKSTIMYALACSRDIWILNRYLEWSIDENSEVRRQDSASVFGAIARQNIGFYVACDFLQRRIKDIFLYHSSKSQRLSRYIEVCADNIIYEDELKKWKEFIAANKEYLKEAQLAANQSIEAALANTKWYTNNYKTITNLLKS
ncbi:aminopeptidase N isoform X2 [Halyomorpha halys]|uniref:aminopeptidase N isoform X2 n=1 Tax=Halyomorpha halys TaxID=286706 RepID=UPI0006D520D7|nr:aminopeptidase N isoform X2 [Halyomorpha halys]